MSKDRLIHSVAGILKYGNEVFCIKRSNELKAFPGYLAFPGGKVEEKDRSFNEVSLEKIINHFPNPSLATESEGKVLFNALIRELEEELNFSIQHEYENNILDIKFILKAIAPSFNPIRFETDFFLIELKNKPAQFSFNKEVKEGMWLDQSKFEQLNLSGSAFMVPPIHLIFRKVFQNHVELEKYDEELSDDSLYPTRFIHNLEQVLVPSNTLEPFFHTNSFVFGTDQNRILVDPSPRNEQILDLLAKYIEIKKVTTLFITHHHQDHCEFLFELHEKVQRPIYAHQKTIDLMIKKESRLSQINFNVVNDGDILGEWNQEPVQLLHVPGHAPGQLALMPKSKKWAIVSDLFQGHGSVVIGTETGNLNDYLNSLQKIINLDPDCVIPSHGIPLGGTKILQKIKFHREYRHQQIEKFLTQKKSMDEIVESLYFGLSDQLQRLGKANIQAHIIKFIEDQKLIKGYSDLKNQREFLNIYL